MTVVAATIRPAARGLATIALAVAVMGATVVVVVAVASRFAATQQYTVFGHPVLVVLSGSMSPAISTGDLIVDDPVSASRALTLRPGEIITFYDRPGSTTVITHRIVGVVHRNGRVLYRTQGDRNAVPDSTLRPASTVIGTYAVKIPRGGTFLLNVRRPLVLALLLAAPILWLLAGPLRRRANDLPAHDQQRRKQTRR